MSFQAHEALCCPLDGLTLDLQSGVLACPQGHSFDVARQGYVNLLLAQEKRSRDPGDSKAMITARRNFLNAGYYAQLAAELARVAAAAGSGLSTVVDAGCGEGYYDAHLLEAVPDLADNFVGFDISKWAVQAAAPRVPATWLVASNRQIPLRDASADMLLSLFGFPELAEFGRVLKSGGLLLIAEAGTEHLLELRRLIYPQLTAKADDAKDSYAAAGFQLQQESRVTYTTAELPQERIAELLLMTPHLYRASAEGKARVAALQRLVVTIDVRFRLYSSAPFAV
ncbi:methyltransferase domain-containing protein [Halieaceae bacterium IMCC14734]|uniref:Methyltransferase domain-containing protein n=1 Tax=Candidatus Litorirhabdus singularis TaxID=2518993 RepID=A0ABT3TCJ6_9GAMM|nr:methyltransferase domain-containing protein [Candidatus Litorirhabdus singularis]MCX2979714.1 methyltransferase domain-containing protein [Candidatus Litorirhabdus singularis]